MTQSMNQLMTLKNNYWMPAEWAQHESDGLDVAAQGRDLERALR